MNMKISINESMHREISNAVVEGLAAAGNPLLYGETSSSGGPRYDLFRVSVLNPGGDEEQIGLSYPMDVTRSCTSIARSRVVYLASLRVYGFSVTVRYPAVLKPDGTFSTSDYSLESLADVASQLSGMYPGKRLPFDPDNKAVVLDGVEVTVQRPNDIGAEWSTPAKIIRTANAFAKRLGFHPMDLTVADSVLARIEAVLLASRVDVDWYAGEISSLYHDHPVSDGVPYTSCMAGRPRAYFEIYDVMQDAGMLRAIEISRKGVHIGRALVWFGTNPDSIYLDRIYAPDSRSTFESGITEAIAEFCRTHHITKAVFSQTATRIPGLVFVDNLKLELPHGLTCTDFGFFPYVDSLRYCGEDGWISQRQRDGVTMDSQSGCGGTGITPCRYEDDDDEDMVELHCGQMVRRELAVETYDGYYGLRTECVEMHNGDYALRGDTTRLTNGEYALDEDAVELHDGGFILFEDAVCLYNGDYAESHEAFELHNGGYALEEDVTELHNGEFALHEDAVELHNGDYALRDDAVRLHDGGYALSDEAIELHNGDYALPNDTVLLRDGTYALIEDAIQHEDGEFDPAVPAITI